MNELEDKKNFIEMGTNTSMIHQPSISNKTHNFTINKTSSRQSTLGTTYNTTAFNNTNFTNVTNFNNDSDDMVLSDDDEDFSKTKSIMPQSQISLQAPSNFSVTACETEITLANVKNSMMTTFSEPTMNNKVLKLIR